MELHSIYRPPNIIPGTTAQWGPWPANRLLASRPLVRRHRWTSSSQFSGDVSSAHRITQQLLAFHCSPNIVMMIKSKKIEMDWACTYRIVSGTGLLLKCCHISWISTRRQANERQKDQPRIRYFSKNDIATREWFYISLNGRQWITIKACFTISNFPLVF